MSSKKSLLESKLVSILSNIGQIESASKKASELAAAIDAYVDARIAGITGVTYRDWETDRKSTRLNSSHITRSRMPSSA